MAPDGRRFLLNLPASSASASPATLIVNWPRGTPAPPARRLTARFPPISQSRSLLPGMATSAHQPPADGPSNVMTTGPWSLVPNSRSTVARCARRGERRRGQHVVDAPADVALLHVAPRRPPGEQLVVVRVERPADVDQAARDDALEQRALLGPLRRSDSACAPSGGRRAPSRATFRSPHRTQRLARRARLGGAGVEACEEAHLGVEVLAAVGHVDRGHRDVAGQRRTVATRCAARSRTADASRPARSDAADFETQQRDARVALLAVPVAPVVLDVAQFERQLVERRLDLLQADDVGVFARRASPAAAPGGRGCR